MIVLPEGSWPHLSGKAQARQLTAQAAASIVRMETYRTIVDMKVDKNGVKDVEPSG